MISSKPVLPLAVVISLLPWSSRAAEAGAWETFSTLDNANAWGVFDLSDDLAYYCQWVGDTPGEEFVLFQHLDDAPLWFFTDVTGNAGGGKLLGDYATPKIQGILAEVYIDAIEEFGELDCAVYTTGPAGTTFYFSVSYYDTDLEESGWHSLRFGFFDQPWYFFNGTSYVPVQVTQQFLSSIQEIGFRFFPRAGTTVDSLAALDNVMLEPLVPTPVLATSISGGNFRMGFTPVTGVTYTVQKLLDPAELGWDIVEADITGTSPYLHETPVVPNSKEFFRVMADAIYTPFITPPP